MNKVKTYFLLVAGALLSFATPISAATLVHSYDFNSGSVVDTTGGLNGTLFGGATISGGELVLNGSGYAQLGGYALPFGTAPFTLALQAVQTARPNWFVELVSQGFSTSGSVFGFYLGHDTTGQIRVTDQFLATGDAYPNDRQYHDIVLTSSVGTGTHLYIDGTAVFSSGSAVSTVGTGTPTRFGQQFNATGGNAAYVEFFTGRIDNVLIYDDALSRTEVAALYAPVPLPSSVVLLLGALATLRLAGRLRTGQDLRSSTLRPHKHS